MTTNLLARLRKALTARPTAEHASACIRELIWLIPTLGICLAMSDTMHWAPKIDTGLLQLALIAIVVPSLGEELLFRVALLPPPNTDGKLPLFRASAAIVLFVAWHPLQAWLFGGLRAQIFLDPWFLLAVAALGLACTRAYWKTGSIWSPVAIHWFAVLGWKAFAGGPPLF